MSAPTNGALSGARGGRASWLARLVARAGAQDLSAFVVPGPDVARAHGLDLEAAGLGLSDTPRHASVLVLVGELPAGLEGAAAVAYAQMPRPRAILAVGTGDGFPLPEPDASAGMGQEALAEAVARLRRSFAEGAFSAEAAGFDVDEIRTRTEYVCPMHPEVVSDEEGSCPKCGMDLVPRGAAGGADHDHRMDHGHDGHGRGNREHPDHEDTDQGSADHSGHGGHDDAGHGTTDRGAQHGTTGSEESGFGGHGGDGTEHGEHGASGPRAHEGPHEGTDHGGADPAGRGGHGGYEGHDNGVGSGGHPGHGGHTDHAAMGHGDHGHGGHGHADHAGMGFMSMVAMTQGTPRGSDGLQMERMEVPFGPLFPGLPAGLRLRLTLDGDTVAESEVAGVGGPDPETPIGPAGGFAERLSGLDPLSSVSYRLLALRAMEAAAGFAADEKTALSRAGALERERAASHLNWVAGFAHLLGYAWLERRAARLQLALLGAADAEEVGRLGPELAGLARRIARTPLLKRKLRGIGVLPRHAETFGPVARARGERTDARSEEAVYRDGLGFEPIVMDGDDAFSRLLLRLEEAGQSLDLVRRAGSASIPASDRAGVPANAREGAATVETPRGAAMLRVAPEGGEVKDFELRTPSARHAGLVGAVTEGEELADALVGVASLDLSPWGVIR